MEKIIKFISSKNFFKNLVAFNCMLFGFTYIMLITFAPIPVDNVRFADTSLGFVLGIVLGTTISYYLGGSKGSADKTELINSMVGNNDTNTKTNTSTNSTTTTNSETKN